jgi:hypothetical protein
MPTILDLFKDQKKDLYGKSENIRIESRGLINPPRGAALLASSPSKLGDLIGNQIAGAIGGSANRPSDTIFKGKSFLSKPISLFKTPGALRNAIEPGTDYFIKPEPPSPNSIIATIKQGASSPLATITNLGISALKGLKDKNPSRGLPYGQKYQNTETGKELKGTKTFSNHFTKYVVVNPDSNNPITNIDSIIERKGGQTKTWDNANKFILSTESLTQDELEKKQKEYELQNQVWVTFKKYGNSEIVPFAGTISSITEDVTPEWTNFRYLGSPFKSYRYLGVERNLNFELKLYYTKEDEKNVMIKKINYLKSLAFPYDQISQLTYKKDTTSQKPTDTIKRGDGEPKSTVETTQYAFSPNLVYLSIGDLYKNMFGFIETLSFSIDDATSWSNSNYNMEDGKNNKIYPSVISVSIGMKLIEQHTTETIKGGITKYKYNFDGMGESVITSPPKTGTTSTTDDISKWTRDRSLSSL